jgi:hypothetical protein
VVAGPENAAVTPRRRRLDGLIDGVAANSLLVVALATLAAVLLSLAPELLVADSWMTLVAGREVAAHGLPATEALTVMPLGREWVDQQWLALLVDVALVTAAFASAVVAARLRGASARSTLFAAAAAMLVAPWAWQLRAQSFALPLFVWVLALASLDPHLRRRRTWLVLPLLVVWANLHGSVLLGAAVVSWAGALGLASRALRRDGAPPAGRAAVFLLAPWACVLASPYALDLPGYYRLLLVDSPVSKVINEWGAPSLHGWFLVFFAVAAATVALVAWKRRSLTWFDVGVLALTLAGSLRSIRGIAWFALAVAVLLPVTIDAAFGGDRGAVRRRVGTALSAAFVALAAAALVGVAARSTGWLLQGWPPQAAEAALRASPPGDAPAVWPSDRHADWLLWLEPRLRGRVAYDVRFELLDERELRSISRYKARDPGWEAPLRGYRVAVVDPRDTPGQAAALTRLGATVLFEDDAVVVLALPRP